MLALETPTDVAGARVLGFAFADFAGTNRREGCFFIFAMLGAVQVAVKRFPPKSARQSSALRRLEDHRGRTRAIGTSTDSGAVRHTGRCFRTVFRNAVNSNGLEIHPSAPMSAAQLPASAAAVTTTIGAR